MTSPKTKPTINNREELIYALCEAAEVEHVLICAYLFTAFSMKRFPDEGIDEIQQDKIRNWKSVILGVAHQEMEHLGLVCNLLNAIGGPQHFSRPNFPQSREYYQTAVSVDLSKFSLQTMAAFMAFEKPDITPADNYGLNFEQIVPTPIVIHNGHTVQELYEAILNGFIFLDGKLKLFIGNPDSQVEDDMIVVGFSNKEYGIDITKVTDLQSAIQAIKRIIEQGEGVILDADHVNTKNAPLTKLYEQFDKEMIRLGAYAIGEKDWAKTIDGAAKAAKAIEGKLKSSLQYIGVPFNKSIVEKTGLLVARAVKGLEALTGQKYSEANAQKAEELRSQLMYAATNDAEGAIIYEIVDDHKCHYIKFWTLYQELKAEKETVPGFEPSRNVADNPMLNRHPETQNSRNIHLVEHGYTRKVLELFNAGYETMVDMLIIFYANDGISSDERTLFVNTAFFPFMTMFIRPVGEVLTMLPIKEDAADPLGVKRAGGSFEYYINTALMPRTEPRWRYLAERLQELALLGKELETVDKDLKRYMPAQNLANLEAQMKSLYVNLNRIFENFTSGMKIKL